MTIGNLYSFCHAGQYQIKKGSEIYDEKSIRDLLC